MHVKKTFSVKEPRNAEMLFSCTECIFQVNFWSASFHFFHIDQFRSQRMNESIECLSIPPTYSEIIHFQTIFPAKELSKYTFKNQTLGIISNGCFRAGSAWLIQGRLKQHLNSNKKTTNHKSLTTQRVLFFGGVFKFFPSSYKQNKHTQKKLL